MRKLLLAALLLSGCGGPPPEGFTIQVRFVSIDTAIIEALRLSFRPQLGERFMAQEAMTYEGGLIAVHIETNGVLVMDIDGDHVRAHSSRPDGTQWVYELEIWSDDPMMNMEPLVLGSVTRSGEFIGDGMVYLPEWPPPLDGTVQIAIECSTTAAAAGLCM